MHPYRVPLRGFLIPNEKNYLHDENRPFSGGYLGANREPCRRRRVFRLKIANGRGRDVPISTANGMRGGAKPRERERCCLRLSFSLHQESPCAPMNQRRGVRHREGAAITCTIKAAPDFCSWLCPQSFSPPSHTELEEEINAWAGARDQNGRIVARQICKESLPEMTGRGA